MSSSLCHHTGQSNKHYSAVISYLSICLGVLFYYLETVHQLFFTLYKKGGNNESISIAFYDALSLGLLFYAIVLAPVYYYYLRIRINLVYRVLLYFFVPSIISLVFWYFYVFVKFPIGSFLIWDSAYANFKTVLIGSYWRGFTIFMTLTCIASDVILSVFRLVIYCVKK